MVLCTTTGNLRECFVKCPRQNSMYDRYGPWRGHDSAFLMGPFTGLADAQKKTKSLLSHTLRMRCGAILAPSPQISSAFVPRPFFTHSRQHPKSPHEHRGPNTTEALHRQTAAPGGHRGDAGDRDDAPKPLKKRERESTIANDSERKRHTE